MFLFSSADFFKIKFSLKNKPPRTTIKVSNSLDPDQDRHSVGLHLGSNCLQKAIDGWLRMGLLPPPREFCRHILSCRELKAESFKRCLHSVLRGVSL